MSSETVDKVSNHAGPLWENVLEHPIYMSKRRGGKLHPDGTPGSAGMCVRKEGRFSVQEMYEPEGTSFGGGGQTHTPGATHPEPQTYTPGITQTHTPGPTGPYTLINQDLHTRINLDSNTGINLDPHTRINSDSHIQINPEPHPD
jgi:hypothetical protein